jgi:hypothetical protein
LEGDLKKLETSMFKEGFDKLNIHLHERIEISSTNASIRLSTGFYNIKKDCITFPLQEVEVRTIKADDFFEIKKCHIEGQMKLMWSSTKTRYQEHVFIESLDCPEFFIAIKGNLLSESIKESQVLMHTLFTGIIIIAQIVCLVLLDIGLQDNLMANQQLSTTTVLILGTLQLVLGFEQLVLSLFDFPYFVCMVIIGICYFNLFFFMVLKTVASAVRYQILYRMQTNPNFNVRTYLLLIYCKAHMTILGTFLISLKLINTPSLFVIWALALTPQMLKNSMSHTRFLSSQHYLGLFFLLTMIYSIYMHFFQFNFFSINNNYNTFNLTYGFKVSIFTLFQLACLICQQNIHPRFFIPKKFRSNSSFEYFFEMKELREGKWKHKHGEQCIICFGKLDKERAPSTSSIVNNCERAQQASNIENPISSAMVEEHKGDDVENPELHGELIDLPSVTESDISAINWREVVNNEALKDFLDTQIDDKKFMGTPCNHVFHTSCLLVWMSQKMECPVCRGALPPIV